MPIVAGVRYTSTITFGHRCRKSQTEYWSYDAVDEPSKHLVWGNEAWGSTISWTFCAFCGEELPKTVKAARDALKKEPQHAP